MKQNLLRIGTWVWNTLSFWSLTLFTLYAGLFLFHGFDDFGGNRLSIWEEQITIVIVYLFVIGYRVVREKEEGTEALAGGVFAILVFLKAKDYMFAYSLCIMVFLLMWMIKKTAEWLMPKRKYWKIAKQKEQIRKELKAHETETALGEPQYWLYLKSGRSIEVTLESDGIQEEDQYYSVRLHCSEKEFEEDAYHETCGIIDMHATVGKKAMPDPGSAEEELFEKAVGLTDRLIASYHEVISKTAGV